MTERPILFSTPMVQAILEGRKTMTRRTVKFPKDFTGEKVFDNSPHGLKYSNSPDTIERMTCPYGNPGDRLWVRETWMDGPNYHNGMDRYEYKASASKQFIEEWPKCWKPSIHMPRAASRITLEITDVSVERLQDITEQDAIKEGSADSFPLSDMKLLTGLGDWEIQLPFLMHQFSFLNSWCKIYGTKSWLKNPWVWVISFKKL